MHDLIDRLAAAVAGEGVRIAGIDDQCARMALAHLFAAQLDLARGAGGLGEDAGYGGPFGQFGEGQIGAVPLLVPGAGDAQRDAADLRQFGEGAGEG